MAQILVTAGTYNHDEYEHVALTSFGPFNTQAEAQEFIRTAEDLHPNLYCSMVHQTDPSELSQFVKTMVQSGDLRDIPGTHPKKD